jgi:hypothetical protein
MSLNPYPIESDENRLIFRFQSISSIKTIQKVILFIPLKSNPDVYNLALCDVDELGELRDDVKSNNDDLERVMATVILTIETFLETNPTKKVFFKGNTQSKTRLYQITINHIFETISHKFYIEGVKVNLIEPFIKNKNYEAFIISNYQL